MKKAALRPVPPLCKELQRHLLPVGGILSEPVFFALPDKILDQRRDEIAAAQAAHPVPSVDLPEEAQRFASGEVGLPLHKGAQHAVLQLIEAGGRLAAQSGKAPGLL